jgi:esterase/lipase
MDAQSNQGVEPEDGERMRASKTLSESDEMSKVREQYEKLVNTIENLEERRSIETQKCEAEFLKLYKSKLLNMKKDFDALRYDIEEKEKAIENNLLVKKLSSERTWYKNEAFKLNEDIEKMKKRVETLEEVEKDRKWLSDQLKTVMKQKAELERLLESKVI